MRLIELIQYLEKQVSYNPNRIAFWGFSSPHSYRGYYERVAFEPTLDVSIKDMLESAKEALGSEYTGWKGGKYTMHEDTLCYLANERNTGTELTKELLHFLVYSKEQ